MTTIICRRPGADVRTPAEKQEAALLAAFRRLTPRGRIMALKAARRLRVAFRSAAGVTDRVI
jgi:hypothetical protein